MPQEGLPQRSGRSGRGRGPRGGARGSRSSQDGAPADTGEAPCCPTCKLLLGFQIARCPAAAAPHQSWWEEHQTWQVHQRKISGMLQGRSSLIVVEAVAESI